MSVTVVWTIFIGFSDFQFVIKASFSVYILLHKAEANIQVLLSLGPQIN